MSDTIKLNESNIDLRLKKYDLENMLSIFKDKNNNFVFNLNETLFINVSFDSLLPYKVNYPMHWSLISYKLYGTTRLAWLLLKLNNVACEDIFKKVDSNTAIVYLDNASVSHIINSINE